MTAIGKREFFAVLGLFFGILFLFFYRCTVLGDYFSPAELLQRMHPWIGYVKGGHANTLRGDDVFLAFPLYDTHFRAMRLGQLPLWDPWKLGGGLGGMQWVSLGQILYPLSMVFMFEPHGPMILWFAILRLLVGGLGVWALLRHFNVSRAGATLAGIAFMLNGASIAWLSSPIPSVMVWLPWAILAVERLIARPSLLAFAGLALAGGSQFLAGYVAESFVFVATAAMYALLRLGFRAGTLGAPALAGRFLLLGAGAIASLAVGALGIIPSLSALQNSGMASRGAGLSYFAPLNAITFLAPNFFGNPAHGSWWTGGNYCEWVAYLGLLPLFFALAALVFQRRNPAIWPFAIVLLVVMGYSYGVWGFKELGNLPGFYQTPTPRWTSAIAFLVAALAGFGWDAIAERPKAALRLWWGAGVVAVLALYLAFSHVWSELVATGRLWYYVSYLSLFAIVTGAATVVLVRMAKIGGATVRHARWLGFLLVLDLSVALIEFNPTADRETFYATTPGIAHLQGKAKEGRVLAYEDMFMGDIAGMYGLESLTGYDIRGDKEYQRFLYEAGDRSQSPDQAVTTNSFLMATTEQGLASVNVLKLNVHPASPLLDLMAVRQLVYTPSATPGAGTPLAYQGPDMRVVDNPHARPWAWWTPDARVTTDDEAYALMRSAPRGGPSEALLASAPASLGLDHDGTGSVRVLERQTSRLRLAIDASSPGFLMLSQRHHRGWRARIDGRPAEVLRADAILTAVPTPAGRHEITIAFEDPIAVGSFASSATGLLGFGGLALFGWRRRARKHAILGE
ncbi:Bacterial membrane protein YfhO [compost metagenome]